MATRETNQAGSVTFDKRTRTWYLRWRDADGRRRAFRIGTQEQYSAREQASLCRAAVRMRERINQPAEPEGITVTAIAERYIAEKLPPHFSTASDYKRLLKARILPQWGDALISDLRPAPVEAWLKSLGLAPKTQANIQGVLRILIEAAQFWGYLKIERNPMELVKIRGCTIRQKEPQILTVDEFHELLSKISDEPLRTMLLFVMCLGLRFSELIALKWSDFDWKNLKVHIRRGAVRQRVGEVKTSRSRKPLPMDPQLAELMLTWYRATAFAGPEDWVWASPYRNGRQPYAYSKLYQALKEASKSAGLGAIGWHTMRHTYRSWLDETGAPMTVQQNLMRHSDIRTTMNIYGDAIPDSLRSAHSKVVRMVIQ
ncbi:MAG: site-specific integrase [Acidobacteriia bacterium]|nr:site-specific integrase [Terriglobia bacterium]